MNIVLNLIPLISTMLGVIYYYNSMEFVELMLAQPVRRRDVFMGKYLGLSLSLAAGFLLGMGIPFLVYGIHQSGEVWNFAMLLVTGVMLTFIFVALAFWASILFSDKIKGFGLAIAIWLFMAVIYDGLFMLILIIFRDYPTEQAAIIFSLVNPIDLSRTLIMLQLDVAALLGYTGAVFNKFFGTTMGMMISFGTLIVWTVLPVSLMLLHLRKKDF
jgi:Cu-processing system permease protein